MKKTLALIFAAMFVLMLFAGCGGTNTTTPTKAPDSGTTTPTKAPDTGKATPAPTAAPTEEPSPYHFAKGKYAVDAEGWPLEKYEYELPLSTTDEKFTNMTLSFTPQYIPEAGMGSMPMYKGMEDMTGVHIEYNVVASAQYSERLGVMEASQDLCDITAGFWAYHQGGSLTQCIDDEMIINHYDYREYAPNFCKWAKDWQHIEGMWGRVNMPTTDKWIAFVDFYDQPCQTTGYFMRGDWLDKLGLDAYDAITFDDWYDQLMAIKVAGFENCEYPLQVYSSIDAYANVWNDFNTTPYASGCSFNRVIDGKVSFNGTTEDDLVLAKYIRKWFEDGIIIPYFQSLSGLDDITSRIPGGPSAAAPGGLRIPGPLRSRAAGAASGGEPGGGNLPEIRGLHPAPAEAGPGLSAAGKPASAPGHRLSRHPHPSAGGAAEAGPHPSGILRAGGAHLRRQPRGHDGPYGMCPPRPAGGSACRCCRLRRNRT